VLGIRFCCVLGSLKVLRVGVRFLNLLLWSIVIGETRLAIHLPNLPLRSVVGRTTAKRAVAGSNLIFDDFSTCTLLACSRGLCGYPGRRRREGVNSG
jgi:hypothetical protein